MSKAAADNKIKKTLVRNYEVKVKPSTRKEVVHDVGSTSNMNSQKSSSSSQKENVLSQPSLCSSGAIANYIADMKKLSAPPVSSEDLNVDKGQLCAKMTKKLNFQFNDRIYKNLIELNANVNNVKSKKDRRPFTHASLKRDLEPNIGDFYEDEKEIDTAPSIPVLKPKFKAVKKVEDGRLHRLVAAFEDL
uniref:Protein phosphatase 1 regulatory subunit 35 C-terminal domain-containing protein n=1 Tax=Heliothis virescens TaxID=7102 RepID=A0A2A4JC12_HELVI